VRIIPRQNAAPNVFETPSSLYFNFLKSEIRIEAVRASSPTNLTVVLSLSEVAKLLEAVQPRPKRLMCSLTYGSGLRLMEACILRVKDIDLDRKQVFVLERRGGKTALSLCRSD
jgi:integrase